jgi:hypothetical protein
MSAISSAMPMAVIIRRYSMIACCSGLKGTSKAELHVLRVPPQRRHSQQGRGDLCRGLRIRLTGDLRSSVAEEARLEDISPLYEATRAGSAFPGQTVSQRVKRGRDQSHLQALTQERPAHQAQLLTTTPLQPSS